jgi:hypothetical protein
MSPAGGARPMLKTTILAALASLVLAAGGALAQESGT